MSTGKLKRFRKEQRHLKNKEKDIRHKQDAWNSGKLIKPNHNGDYYDEIYSTDLGNRLVNKFKEFKKYIDSTPGQEIENIDWNSLSSSEQHDIQNSRFINRFRQFKVKSIEYILRYNPNIEKSNNYFYIKKLLEHYWDNSGKNLIDIV